MTNTLSLPKAKMNGTGVVKKPDGQVRHEQMIEEIQNPEVKENDDGNKPRIRNPNRPV